MISWDSQSSCKASAEHLKGVPSGFHQGSIVLIAFALKGTTGKLRKDLYRRKTYVNFQKTQITLHVTFGYVGM